MYTTDSNKKNLLIYMLLSPIAVCEIVWAEIVFWSKFPAVRKIIMKLDYRFCDRSYYIVTVIPPVLPENSKLGSMYVKCILYMVVKSYNPHFVLFR